MKSVNERRPSHLTPEGHRLVGQAYENYRKCGYQNGFLTPSLCLSIAVMYYVINQYHDSFEILTWVVSSHPFQWEIWYNIGVLVSSDINEDACIYGPQTNK